MTFKGHSRSSAMSRFDTAHMTSYYHSIVTIAYLLLFPAYRQTLVEIAKLIYPTCIQPTRRGMTPSEFRRDV